MNTSEEAQVPERAEQNTNEGTGEAVFAWETDGHDAQDRARPGRFIVLIAAVLLGALIAGACAGMLISHRTALRRAAELPRWESIPGEELEAYRSELEAAEKESALRKAQEEERERLERARKEQEAREEKAAREEKKEAQEEEKKAQEAQTEQTAQGVLPDHIIFVGDSRTVQMKRAVKYDRSVCSFIAESSMGYEWFRDEAVPAVDSALYSMGGNIAIVVNMGVNDLSDVEWYTKLVNRKAAEWASRGADTYYMSVNPVDDGRTQVKNSQIEEFNTSLQDSLDTAVAWIDCYGFLMAYGYESADGLHFTDDTSRDIYRYCLDQLERY